VTQVASPYGGTDTVVNAGVASNNPGTPGPLVTGASVATIPGYGVTGAFVTFTVTSEGNNLVDPDSATVVPGPGVMLQIDVYSNDPNIGSEAPLYQDVSAYPAGIGQDGLSPGFPYTIQLGSTTILTYNLSNITTQDVGATSAFLIVGATKPTKGQQLTINDGGQEGQTLGISLPTVNTNALGISDVSCVLPQVATIIPGSGSTPQGPTQTVGTAQSNNIPASYSQLLVQSALQTITTNEAQIGAQIIAMNDDTSDDNNAIVNLQASVSNITDLNVGQATTDYTREQILTSVGTEVLSQIQSNGKIMTALLIQALIA
jgi:flagellin-like hook-associated protein FlgL